MQLTLKSVALHQHSLSPRNMEWALAGGTSGMGRGYTIESYRKLQSYNPCYLSPDSLGRDLLGASYVPCSRTNRSKSSPRPSNAGPCLIWDPDGIWINWGKLSRDPSPPLLGVSGYFSIQCLETGFLSLYEGIYLVYFTTWKNKYVAPDKPLQKVGKIPLLDNFIFLLNCLISLLTLDILT